MGLFYTAESDRMEYMDNLKLPFKHGVPHCIDRSKIYADVIDLYTVAKDGIFNERPFRVRFKEEKALDIGGVARDMFSAFYEEIYLKLFDGACLFTPTDFPNSSSSPLPVLGTIFSHAYIMVGTLPVKVAFPCLCSILLGQQKACSLPDNVLVKSFTDSLCAHEARIVTIASKVVDKAFPEEIQDGLTLLYSRFGVREFPKPSNFLSLIAETAKFHFIRKPAAAVADIRSGIPMVHSAFWSRMSVGDLYSVYKALQATPAKVLALLDDAFVTNLSRERVFGYLQQYVGNMQEDELSYFLRFVTGSSVCSSKTITIIFNSTDGLKRIPIGHTCSGQLELSTTYSSYLDFVAEFKAVLSNRYSWRMDAI
jgi:hypothetical protein